MLQAIRSAGDSVFIWSYEKIFMVEPQVNTHNDRVLAASSDSAVPSIRTAYSRQMPAGVMVWAAVASAGQKSPLVFILEDVKVNTQVNLNLLRDHALPWARGSFPNGYVFT